MSGRPHLTRLRNLIFFSLPTLYELIRNRQSNELVRKVYRLWKRAGTAGVWRRLLWMGHATLGYARWVKQFDTLDAIDRREIREHIDRFHNRPCVSVLMPTYNSPELWLRRAIDSVRNQLYPDWELCIADDASTEPHVRAVLEEYQRLDERIRLAFRDCNGHISAASNSALAIATGEFVALLDQDDELSQHALYLVALAAHDFPELNLIYSDEDKIDEQGRRFGPYFKPDWNPDLLTAQNMVSHLGVYRTDVLRSVGGFREGVEGSQDWDAALRVAERVSPSTIRHIPHVLYHWRAVAGSTALGHEEKSYVVSASERVVREHLQRINQPASVGSAFSSYVRVQYPIPTPVPLVSIILANDSADAVELKRRTQYPALEIISYEPTGTGTSADSINLATTQARGELLCILHSGLLPESADWLEQLVAQAIRSEIGAVGPLQLDVEGQVRGALTVLCNIPAKNRVSWSFYQGMDPQENGVAGRAALPQNVTVLSPGCLVLRTEVFRAMNGFDSNKFPSALFELDLCLRLVQAGYRNLWTPYARIVSTVPLKTRLYANSQEEAEQFRMQWRDCLDHDPAHNPNLSCDGEWPFPAFPPRKKLPWRAEIEQ